MAQGTVFNLGCYQRPVIVGMACAQEGLRCPLKEECVEPGAIQLASRSESGLGLRCRLRLRLRLRLVYGRGYGYGDDKDPARLLGPGG